MNLSSIVLRLDTQLFLVTVIVFFLFPSIDIKVADLFFNDTTANFPGREFTLVEIIYWAIAYIHIPMLFILAVLTCYYFLTNKQSYKKKSLFLLLALLLGPGITVNLLLKDNSLGRARPLQVQEFGGTAKFTTPFEYSGECKKNCSFTSGHSSIGFVLIALAWVTGRNKYFALGLIAGFSLGLLRIIQGGHFLSDVVFSFWAVYFVTLILKHLFNLHIYDLTDTSRMLTNRLANLISK